MNACERCSCSPPAFRKHFEFTPETCEWKRCEQAFDSLPDPSPPPQLRHGYARQWHSSKTVNGTKVSMEGRWEETCSACSLSRPLFLVIEEIAQ
jgi:hypothetical protein